MRSPALMLTQTLFLIALLSIVSCARRVSKVHPHAKAQRAAIASKSTTSDKLHSSLASSTPRESNPSIVDDRTSATPLQPTQTDQPVAETKIQAEVVLSQAAREIAAWASLRRQRPMLPISQRVDQDVIRVTLVSGRGERIYDEHILSVDGRMLLQDAVELESVHHRLGAAHSWASCLDKAEVTLALPQAVSPQAVSEQAQAKSLLGTFGEPLQKSCVAGDQHCPKGSHVVWWIGSKSYQGRRSIPWLEALTSCKSPSL